MVQMQDVMSKAMPDFREGSIVKGRILEVRPREVLVDIGYKSEGVISIAEFEDVENLEVGDEVLAPIARDPEERGLAAVLADEVADDPRVRVAGFEVVDDAAKHRMNARRTRFEGLTHNPVLAARWADPD